MFCSIGLMHELFDYIMHVLFDYIVYVLFDRSNALAV